MMTKRNGPIRYAVVGLGHISQQAMLPAFAGARRNSRVTALVSDDPAKRAALGRKYKVASTFSYADYEACLAEVDAVYIGLPNSLHAEFTIRAARAGVHVLCEKPLAVTVAEGERMLEACRQHRVKLMTAYRLHFEELTLRVIELVQSGAIGEPKFFNAAFSFTVRDGNIRTRAALGGGTLPDIGVYCINAARALFRAEPRQVVALSTGSGRKFSEVDEQTGAVLRFEGGRLAAFVTSFNAAYEGSYQIIGTKGAIHVDPGFTHREALAYELIVDGKRVQKVRIERRDQFAAQLQYFSDCILANRTPEPSGEEGLQDVRIVEALYRAARTGKAVSLPPFRKRTRPGIELLQSDARRRQQPKPR